MTKARQKRVESFHIDYYSDIDEMRYQGAFTIKKLSLADIAALGVRKAQLNGGMYHDPDRPGQGVDFITDDFNAMLAHLELSVTASPKWWALDTIADPELLNLVYLEVTKFEDSFLHRKRNQANSESVAGHSRSGEADQEETHRSGDTSEVVGNEVFAALEP